MRAVELSRNAQLMEYLVRRLPGVQITVLAKLLYLADLESRKLQGRPLTSFDYWFDNHGPFDGVQFYRVKDELEGAGRIRETRDIIGGYPSRLFYPAVESWEAGDLDPTDVAILQYIADQFGRYTARAICLDVVYETPPMKQAVKGYRLDVEMMNRQNDDPQGFSLEKLLRGEADAAAGRVKSLDSAIDELLSPASR